MMLGRAGQSPVSGLFRHVYQSFAAGGLVTGGKTSKSLVDIDAGISDSGFQWCWVACCASNNGS